jgi:hypothetical protein
MRMTRSETEPVEANRLLMAIDYVLMAHSSFSPITEHRQSPLSLHNLP